MKVRVETITPAKAKNWLKFNLGNFRGVDKERVVKYAKIMLEGGWEDTSTIIFGEDGILVDGQHRLLAVVESGATIRAVVIREAGDVGLSVDRGRPRTISQWLKHKGYKNTNELAAVAKLAVAHRRNMWAMKSFPSHAILDTDIVDYIDENCESLTSAIHMAKRIKKMIPGAITGSIFHIGCGKHLAESVEEVVYFCEKMKDGTGLDKTDAILHLRNRIGSQTTSSMISRSALRFMTTKAWNKLVLGETCSPQELRVVMSGPKKHAPPEKVLVVEGG